MIEMKIDNRYKDGKIVKKNGKLIGNKITMHIETIENPLNPLQPILRVTEPLAKHLSATKGGQ